ncbi:MAG TPA: hypothetical protein VIW24_12640 [Aldersonia sp.]
MGDLTVDDVDLTTLPAQRLTQAMADSGAVFHDLAVTLSNHGAATQFVPTEVTRIRYDPQTRVLQLHSGDDDTDEDALCPPHPTTHTAIRPGTQTRLDYRLVSPITYSTADGEMHTVRIDVDVDAVDCTVAYGDEEPPEFVNLTARMPSPRPHHEVRARWQRP